MVSFVLDLMVERTDVPWVIDLFDVYRFLALRSYDSRYDNGEENILHCAVHKHTGT